MSTRLSALAYRIALPGLIALSALATNFAVGQVVAAPPGGESKVCIIVPQHRVYRPSPTYPIIEIEAVNANVEIVDQVAATTLEIIVRNLGSAPAETELLVPAPAGASVRRFGYDGAGTEPTARILPHDEARRLYESIVRQMRDPALLEFAGYNLLRSSVFPVPAGKSQKVWITYDNLLTADGNRVDYVLPRSESLERAAVKWKITASVRSQTPLATVYSPSHELTTTARGPGSVAVEVPERSATQPGAFRLSFVRDAAALSASLLAYPEAQTDGGYFLFLAGLPQAPRDAVAAKSRKREVLIVLDRSGSMRGEKMEQARNAALQVVEGLEAGEAFNIIDYSDQVALFAPKPVIKDAKTLADARAYLKGIRADGGTDIHTALQTAMSQPATEGMLPVVLFLTDGLPTVGNTSELGIREDTAKANIAKRRVFTFGVGLDVNAALLDQIAQKTRATSINVLPTDNIETAVSTVFRRLSGPVLAEPKLTALDANGQISVRAVRELLPAELPDLFDGDQLVLLGQYATKEPLHLRLSGEYLGAPKSFDFEFKLDNAGVQNAYVPRLWASRKIGSMIDAIRQLFPAGTGMPSPNTDPRVKELVDEIVRLSTRFGILTEYTAFIATDGANVPRLANGNMDLDAVRKQTETNTQERAANVRSGAGGVAQSINMKAQVGQSCANGFNSYVNDQMQVVSNTNVQQLADGTLFRCGKRWVDARIYVDKSDSADKPDQVVEFATPEYFELAERLSRDGRSGMVSLLGEVFVVVDGKRVLVKNPEQAEESKPGGC